MIGRFPPGPAGVVRIAPGQRLVVLARTLDVADASFEVQARQGAGFGETFLGRSLYRHRAIFKGMSDAPAWSHLELSWFRDLVPEMAVDALVRTPQPDGIRLLRAEILLATPASFMMPRDWSGLGFRPDLQASLEYLDVRPAHLADYRDVMQDYIGPAAGRLVAAGRFGTFRAMETAAVLHRDPGFAVEWNQIHLAEVPAEGFTGFGEAFDEALRELSPDGGFRAVFARLEDMRTIPRWTFNEPVLEADGGLLKRLG